MKFGHLFEFHKIPEWYTEYVQYKDLRKKIDEFKSLVKEGHVRKLKGYWTINKKGQIFCIDFIQDFKSEIAAGNLSPRTLKKRARTISRVDESDVIGGTA